MQATPEKDFHLPNAPYPLAATASMGRCEDTGRRVLNRKCCPQSKDPETRRDQTPNLATL